MPAAATAWPRPATLLGLDGDAVVVNVQGDEPLIDPALIDACAALLGQRRDCVMATAAHAIDDAGRLPEPERRQGGARRAGARAVLQPRAAAVVARRQRQGSTALPDPAPLRHVGLYAYRAGFLRRFPTLPMAPLERIEALEQLRVLWHGDRIAVHVTEHAPGPGRGHARRPGSASGCLYGRSRDNRARSDTPHRGTR